MDLNTSTVTNVVLILIFLTLAIACWVLYKIFKALPKSGAWEEILDKRTEMNFQMMSEAHRGKLNLFMDSEAALADAIEQRANAERTTIEKDHAKAKWHNIHLGELIMNGWNKNKGWLKEKLLDKINDIVRGALGGGKSSK